MIQISLHLQSACPAHTVLVQQNPKLVAGMQIAANELIAARLKSSLLRCAECCTTICVSHFGAQFNYLSYQPLMHIMCKAFITFATCMATLQGPMKHHICHSTAAS